MSVDAAGATLPPARPTLFTLLSERLPVVPAQSRPDGTRSRGWTLRPTRLNPDTARFDWIDGTDALTTSKDDREALRSDVYEAVKRLVAEHGYVAHPQGTGLTIAAV